MSGTKIYIVELYFWAESSIDKVFLDEKPAREYVDFMNKTCEKEYKYRLSEKEASNGFNINDYKLYREVSRDFSDWEERSEIEISEVSSIEGEVPQSEICDEGELFLYYEVSDIHNYNEEEITKEYLRLESEIKTLKSSGRSHSEIRDMLFPGYTSDN